MAVSVVKPQFDDAGHGSVSSETIFAAFDQALGTAPERPSNAATVVTAGYQVSFSRARDHGADGLPVAVACAYAGGGDGESVFMPHSIPDTRADARGAKHPIRTGAW